MDSMPEWERFIVFWCNEFDLLRNHIDSDRVLTIYYELLVSEPQQSFEEVRNFLNVSNVSFQQFLKMHGKVSKTADLDSAMNADVLMQWMNKLDSEKKQKLQSYLDYFEIHDYQADQHMPAKKVVR